MGKTYKDQDKYDRKKGRQTSKGFLCPHGQIEAECEVCYWESKISDNRVVKKAAS